MDRQIRLHSNLFITASVMAVPRIFDTTAILVGFCAGRADNNVTFVAVFIMGIITASVSTVGSYIIRDGRDQLLVLNVLVAVERDERKEAQWRYQGSNCNRSEAYRYERSKHSYPYSTSACNR